MREDITICTILEIQLLIFFLAMEVMNIRKKTNFDKYPSKDGLTFVIAAFERMFTMHIQHRKINLMSNR